MTSAPPIEAAPPHGAGPPAPERARARADSGATWRALLLLLPAALLAIPIPVSLLTGDRWPELTATGLAALAALPAAVVAALRAPTARVRGLTLFLLPLVIGGAWLALAGAYDSLEADRARLGALVATVMLLAGAQADEATRVRFAYGAVAVSALLLGGAWLDPHGVGALGNTGDVSEAALPGAIVATVLALAGGSARAGTTARVLCGAVVVGYLTWVLRAPVLAGVVSFGAALVLAAVCAARALPRVALGLGAAGASAFALLPLALSPALLGTPGEAAAAPPASEAEATARLVADTARPGSSNKGSSDTGGIEVRRRVWAATIGMIGDNALLGVGPGQFAREFPRYRDPVEIELSSHARRASTETEVEHAHNDWLQVVAEAGLLGGLAWVLFLVLVLVRATGVARSAARGERPGIDLALGAAAIGLLANAAVHAPLSDDPLSSTLAFALFGMLLARPVALTTGRDLASALRGRAVPVVAALALAFAAPAALELVRHGRVLAKLSELGAPSSKQVRAIAERALEARDDSVGARAILARIEDRAHRPPRDGRGDESGGEDVRAAWRRVLELRPHRIEALMQTGTSHARSGHLVEARAFYEHALELDPAHPGLLWNLARVELLAGRSDVALGLLDQLAERAPIARDRLDRLGAELCLRGHGREGVAVLERSGRLHPETGPDALWGLSKEQRQLGDDALADALEVQAHRGWGRRHAADERWHDAVRSYRQALRLTRGVVPEGALRVRMELAAAALADGDEDTARGGVDGARPSASDWAAMPAWAGTRLLATGWFSD